MYLKLKSGSAQCRKTDVLMENIILQFVLSLGGADFYINYYI